MHFTLLKRIFRELPNSNTVFGARLSSSYSSKSHYFTSTTSLASIPRNTGHWKWPITNVRDPRSRGGSRMWYPPVNTKEDARNIALNLDPTGRKLLMEELKVIEEEKVEGTRIVESPSRSDLAKVFLVNCLPFIGFGILDNGIMIIAGEYIDLQLGIFLGISTMAAAALGNLVSDLAGVFTAGSIENTVEKFQSIQPNLAPDQFHLKQVRWTTSFSRAIGITVGCLLGMIPLLFFDHSKDSSKDRKSASEVVLAQPALLSGPNSDGRH